MAYYANAKGGIPFFKREEERRWNDHLKKHKEFVDHVKPTVSLQKNAEQYDFLRYNASNVRYERERLEHIESENNYLLAKLVNVKMRNNDTYNGNPLKLNKSVNSQSIHDIKKIRQNASYDDESVLKNNDKSYSDDDKNKQIKTSMSVDENPYCPIELKEFMKIDRVIMTENIRLNKKLTEIKQGKYKHHIPKAAEQDNNHRLLEKSSHSGNEEYDKKEILRKAENVRLNKKLQDIKKGKGRKPADDPQFDPGERWWVTSPRARDLAKMHKKAEEIRNEIRLKREIAFKKEYEHQLKLMKEREDQKNQKEVPPGYHVKLRKKKKNYIDEKNNDKEKVESK
ncbi:uncharacterized protein LOC100198818 isoform X1 [Hydra vulgaris]|uniref:uncharacterized protein LOC100198818 isoform X1 n=1 Tax=Hydra vulgaris TaxID=6087 RepID=UPI0006414238|nr:uncharacterized protein LOC100198818 isoform X1 [Hydra vulgaris]